MPGKTLILLLLCKGPCQANQRLSGKACGRHHSARKLTPLIQRHVAFEFEVLSA